MSTAPNIVVIQCDQMRAFDVGCYGHPYIRTPHIDRLAAEGVRFDLAVSNTPVCSPARAAMLTGQHARTCVGTMANAPVDPPPTTRDRMPQTTLPEALRAAGYQTQLIGKWHLWDGPNASGFDRATFAEVPHRHYHQRYYHDLDRAGFVVEHFGPGYELEQVKSYLADRATRRDEPFFLHYNPGPPHMPVGPGHAPQKYVDMYDPQRVEIRPNALNDQGQMAYSEKWFKIYTIWDYWMRCFDGQFDRPTDRMHPGMTLRELTAWYQGLVTLVDDLVAEVMATLRAHGLDENTIVVFTSDHGDNLGSHGRFNKGMLNEESTRVPLIFWQPGELHPHTNHGQVAQTIDLMPTLLSLCDLPIPEAVQGRDLSPLLRGRREALDDDAAIIESPEEGVGIRTPRYLLGVPHEAKTPGRRDLRDQPTLLYDLQADPLQRRNLIDDPDHALLKAQLHERLRQWDAKAPWFQPQPTASG